MFSYRKEDTVHQIKYLDIQNNERMQFRYKSHDILKIEQQKISFGDIAEIFQGEINVSVKKEFFINNEKEHYLPLYR